MDATQDQLQLNIPIQGAWLIPLLAQVTMSLWELDFLRLDSYLTRSHKAADKALEPPHSVGLGLETFGISLAEANSNTAAGLLSEQNSSHALCIVMLTYVDFCMRCLPIQQSTYT